MASGSVADPRSTVGKGRPHVCSASVPRGWYPLINIDLLLVGGLIYRTYPLEIDLLYCFIEKIMGVYGDTLWQKAIEHCPFTSWISP